MQGVTIAGDKQHSELWSLSYTIHRLTHKPSWWEKKKFKISSIGMDNAVLEASTSPEPRHWVYTPGCYHPDPVRATINDVTLRETDATDKWGGAKASNSSNKLGDLMRLAVLESGLPCDFPLVWPSWGMADANECAKLAAQLRALEPVMADLCKPANKAKLRAAVAAHPVYAHQWAARGVTITDKEFVHDMCKYGTTFLLEFQAFIKWFEVGANNGGCAWIFADYEGVSGTPPAPGQPWKPQYPHEPKIYWQNFKDSVRSRFSPSPSADRRTSNI